jgi:hypothetical protein
VVQAGLLALGLTACAGPVPERTAMPATPAAASEPSALSASSAPAAPPSAAALCRAWLDQPPAPGQLLRLEAAESKLRIHAFRAGRLAALGHNHVLSLPQWQGHAWLPQQGLDGARLALDFELADLQLDRPEWRAELGPEFATMLSPEAVAATRANLLKALEAQSHPGVQLRAERLAGAWPWLALRLSVRLHGQTRLLDLPLRADWDGQRLRVEGRLLLRQSDFGLQPFSVLGGALAVQDELVLDFALLGRPVQRCE